MNAFSQITAPLASSALIDQFGRTITYLRVSVTDRCDLRCTYCMAENPAFLPKSDLLTLNELERICSAFIRRGVRRLRLTGGEPLMRRNLMSLVRALGTRVRSGELEELTLTTNGTQLARYAAELAECGVRRINVSLDTLDREKFRAVTRTGNLEQVLLGIAAAQAAGIAVKINTVALKGINDRDIPDMLRWAHGRGMEMTLIETMPLGETGVDRIDQYVPLSALRGTLARDFTLEDLDRRTGGPARYVRVQETGGTLGFITPLTHNFCENCNRVRVTCTGTLYMCLGQEGSVDLREAVRMSDNDGLLMERLTLALALKPRGHDFVISPQGAPQLSRNMNTTGG